MTAREAEREMLRRCASVARAASAMAFDQKEANVFRLAAMVVQSRFPKEAAQLMQVSDGCFSSHPADLLPAAEVVRRGWVISLPRLRDRLIRELAQQ